MSELKGEKKKAGRPAGSKNKAAKTISIGKVEKLLKRLGQFVHGTWELVRLDLDSAFYHTMCRESRKSP